MRKIIKIGIILFFLISCSNVESQKNVNTLETNEDTVSKVEESEISSQELTNTDISDNEIINESDSDEDAQMKISVSNEWYSMICNSTIIEIQESLNFGVNETWNEEDIEREARFITYDIEDKELFNFGEIPQCFSVSEENIYYFTKDEFVIFDREEKTSRRINIEHNYVNDFAVLDDSLFFFTCNELVRFNIREEKEELKLFLECEKIYDIYFESNGIYVFFDDEMNTYIKYDYKLNEVSSDNYKFFKGFEVYNNTKYFCTREGIYEEDNLIIDDSTVYDLFLIEGSLYYTSLKDEGQIIKYDIDKKEMDIVYETSLVIGDVSPEYILLFEPTNDKFTEYFYLDRKNNELVKRDY